MTDHTVSPEDADMATICPYRFPLPHWAGEDQMDRQRCALPSGHAREHATTSPVAG